MNKYIDYVGLAVPHYLFEYEGKSYYGVLIAVCSDGRYALLIGWSRIFWTLEEMPEGFRTPLLLAKAKYPCEAPFPHISWGMGSEIIRRMGEEGSAMKNKPVPGVLVYTGLYMVTMPREDIEIYSKKYGVKND